MKTPQLVIALDNCTVTEAGTLVDELSEAGVTWFKVGLELFSQGGPQLVKKLKDDGRKVFLDLKLHDIPNTVSKAVKAAVATGADLLTVHCSGGSEMLAAAQEATRGSQLSLLGVTVLTSLDGPTREAVCQAFGACRTSSRAATSCSGSPASLPAPDFPESSARRPTSRAASCSS